MGKIHVIRGISIYLYSRDHNPPHIHAFYAEHEVLVAIMNRKVIRGYLPKPQLRVVMDWLEDQDRRKNLVRMFYDLNPNIRKK